MFIAPISLYSANTNKFCSINNRHICFSGRYVSYNEADELIKNGNYDDVKRISDIHIINNKSESLLHSAAKHSQVDISRYLLHNRLDPNLKNYHGKTPFSIACSKMNKSLVETFLLYDVDVNTTDELRSTPLHKAVGSPDVTKLLLEHNANSYAINDFGETPLGLSYNNPKTLEVYLKHGVNPNTENKNSQTLMHSAIANNKIDIANLLKSYGADINYKDKNGRSPIFYTNNPESIKWLIKNGVNLNIKDVNGQTVLHKHVQESHINLAKGLIKYGADVNIVDNRKLPPLAYAKNVKMMELLLSNGANPDIITPKGSTILHQCAAANNLEAVYYLMQYKASSNIKDKDNKIPLDVTTNNDIRALLLVSGSDPNYRPYLIQSLKSNNNEFFDYLIECGANPNLPDETGKTALFFINNEKQVEELKKHNANFNYYNNEGYTPLLHFALLGDKNKVNILKSKGAKILKSRKGETLEDCFQKYETYHKWIKQPKKTPIFTGKYQYYEYGTPELRNNLNYKTQLTKEKIDTIIANAPSTDKGLVEAYKQLKTEEMQIYTAINSLNPIIKHFNIMIKDDISKLVSANPRGSKIPIVGIVRQYEDTVFSDKFIDELKSDVEEIKAQYEEIIKNYYSKNIIELVSNYQTLNKYLSEGIEYINYVQGSSNTRNKLLENLKNSCDKCQNGNKKCKQNINKISKKYENTLNKIIENQEKKQGKRTARKTVIKIMSLGLS